MLLMTLAALYAQSTVELQDTPDETTVPEIVSEPATEPSVPTVPAGNNNNSLSLTAHYGMQFVDVEVDTLGLSDYGFGGSLSYRHNFSEGFAASIEGDFTAYRYTRFGYEADYFTGAALLLANLRVGDSVLVGAGAGADYRVYDYMIGIFPIAGLNVTYIRNLGKRAFIETGIKGRITFQMLKDDSYGNEIDYSVKGTLGAGFRF